jgi:DNA-binding MarR family transcriptional regulator
MTTPQAPATVTSQDDRGELPARIRTAVGRLGRRLRQTRAGAGLTPSQSEVLMTIVKRGPLRLSDVAVIEGLNPTMLSRTAGKLEAAELVTRTQDPSDGRAVFLAPTKRGRDLITRIRRERTDALTIALEGMSEVDRRTLEAALPILESIAETLKSRTP